MFFGLNYFIVECRVCGVHSGQNMRARARQVHIDSGRGRMGLLELRHSRLFGRSLHSARLLSREAGEAVHGPRPSRLHGRLEHGVPFRRRQHQKEDHFCPKRQTNLYSPSRHWPITTPRHLRGTTLFSPHSKLLILFQITFFFFIYNHSPITSHPIPSHMCFNFKEVYGRAV